MTLADNIPAGSAAGEESAWDTAVSTDSPSHFRPDIEGLRAVAILAVLAFHTRIPGFSGGFVGVDVFFVISGFLITGLLLREIRASGRIDLTVFYARRARRLLPAALVVIAVTVAVSAVVLSPLRFPAVSGDGAAAALYVSNYRYALVATDYFAADAQPSPLLHFWSLGVEEQFYLFWPILLLSLSRLLPIRRFWPAIAVIALASFAASVLVTNIEMPWAFYSLPTRAWQLSLGALVALGVLALPSHMPRWFGGALGALGLAIIATSVIAINPTTPYPGLAALLPAMGAALFIVGGDQPGALPARWLATGPPRWVGRISYSLYLWHWPILILGPIIIGQGGLRVRIPLALLSILVAALSTRFIETPFRARVWSRASGRTLVLAASFSAAIAVASLAAAADFTRDEHQTPLPTLGPVTSVRPQLPEPVLAGPLPDDLQPTLLDAPNDRGAPGLEGCRSGITESTLRDCTYGDPSAPTVVVFGDSHASMWLPTVRALADDAPWRLVPLIKPGCSPVDVTIWRRELQRAFRECDAWRGLALQRIRELHPAIVFVTSSRNYQIADAAGNLIESDISELWRTGLVGVLDELRQSSDRVVLIGETPHFRDDPLECLAVQGVVEECAEPRAALVSTAYQRLEESAARAAGADLVKPIDWLCQKNTCALILDHYLVYRNPGHLTATITTVLAPQLRWALDHAG
ncbi:MAG: acyltransferase family protein [Chloroflexota bacterium]